MIHTIWLGSDIPVRYHNNIKTHRQLNLGFQFVHWSDNDVINILNEYNSIDTYNTLPFLGRFNLAKYTILDKFGGVFTDLDIKWKKSFIQIMNEHNFNDVDLILTYTGYSGFYLNDERKFLLDDPFVIAKKEVLKKCLDYRLNRTLRIDPDTNEVHKSEPIGPFLLSEWVYNNNIKVSSFSQKNYLDWSGYYGDHEQFGLWIDRDK